ncbi:hypothetical protein Tco_1335868 [Tanacetum coccineum]
MRIVSRNAPPSSNSSSNFEFQQMAAALEDKMTLTFRNEMNEMKNMMKAFVLLRFRSKRLRKCVPYVVSSQNSPEPSLTQVDNSPPSNESYKETRLPYTFLDVEAVEQKKDSNDKVQIQKFWNCFKNPRVPLILGRPFLRTARVLIDVHGEELVIRDGLERIVFKPDGSQDNESIHMMDVYDDRVKDVCEPESNDDSTTSAIVDDFESLLGDIIKQKEELKGISDPVARRRACFANLDKCKIISQGRVIHSPKKASISAISHIFPNNNFEDSFTMGNEDLNSIPNKELDKEILIPIPRESKIGKDCDFPSCDDFQSFKTFSNPLFEKQDDFPSRNDESILKEETFKSYLNPLFEDDEEIISNEVSSIISPKVDVKTIMSFFAPIGNCVRKWATSEFEKDNVEVLNRD